MKRKVFLMLIALMAALFALAAAEANVVVDGVTFSDDKKTLISCPKDFSGKCTIPSGVTKIEKNAFSGCAQLTSVSIPKTVTTIGQGAFLNCTALDSVYITSGVKTIMDEAFRGCSALKRIAIPGNVTSLGQGAFCDCAALADAEVLAGLTYLPVSAFANCASLSVCTLSDTIASIGEQAFYGCAKLKSLNVPVSVTQIDNMAFAGCALLKEITLPAAVKTFSGMPFDEGVTLRVRKNSAAQKWASEHGFSVSVIDESETSILAGTRKMLRMLGNQLPAYIESDMAEAVSGGIEQVLKTHQRALFISVSKNMALGAFRYANGAWTTIARSYETASGDAPFTANDVALLRGLYTPTGYGRYHTILVVPFESIIRPYVMGSVGGESFDMGLGLFDRDKGLLDVNRFSDYPIDYTQVYYVRNKWTESGNLDTLSGVYLRRDDQTEFQSDRYLEQTSAVKLALPASLKRIEDEAFAGDDSLSGMLTIPDGVTAIGSRILAGTNVGVVSLPASVTSIADDAFDSVMPQPTLMVVKDSYAEKWAKAHNFTYTEK